MHAANTSLQFSGLKGEGFIGLETWIKKSHFPFTMPFYPDSEHDIAVICTRYQVDCDVSHFYVIYTQTHGIEFNNELLKEPIKKHWEDYLYRSTFAYKKWYNYWIRMAETTERPIYFFRFEDVIANKEKELNEVMRFILGLESLEGTVV